MKSIIDVRSPEEFQLGHAKGAINIPLNEVEDRISEIKKIEGRILLCCASGARSGMAEQILHSNGIDCENAGSWFDVDFYEVNI